MAKRRCQTIWKNDQLKTIIQRSWNGIVEQKKSIESNCRWRVARKDCWNDLSTVEKSDRYTFSFNDRQKRSLNDMVKAIIKGDLWQQLFNDRNRGMLTITVQRSVNEIVERSSERLVKPNPSTIRQKGSVNDHTKRSLETSVDRSKNEIVTKDRPAIVGGDC